jgi:hypothetical protein
VSHQIIHRYPTGHIRVPEDSYVIAKNEKDAGDSVSRIYLEQVLGIGFVLVECDATKPAELFSQLLGVAPGN